MKVHMFVRNVNQEASVPGSPNVEHVTLQVPPDPERKEGEVSVSGTLNFVIFKPEDFGKYQVGSGLSFDI